MPDINHPVFLCLNCIDLFYLLTLPTTVFSFSKLLIWFSALSYSRTSGLYFQSGYVSKVEMVNGWVVLGGFGGIVCGTSPVSTYLVQIFRLLRPIYSLVDEVSIFFDLRDLLLIFGRVYWRHVVEWFFIGYVSAVSIDVFRVMRLFVHPDCK